MRTSILFTVLLSLGISVAASAQSFNPRVEVTNSYQTKAMVGNKNSFEMSVPDSLMSFDYDFDYSVFDSPYKGSYEFSPYLINMKPQASNYGGQQFFLRAGAGYSLHPEANIVYTPKLKSNDLKIRIFDDFSGFFGNYQMIKGYHMSADDTYLVSNQQGGVYAGSDMGNTFGASVTYTGEKTIFSLEATYRLIAASDTTGNHMYNQGSASLRFASNPYGGKRFTYDFTLQGKMGEDDITYNNMGFAVGNTEINGKLALQYRFPKHSSIGVDVGTAMGFYNRMLSSYVMNYYAVPKYIWTNGRFMANLGVRVSYLMGQDNTINTIAPMHATKSNLLYPDVHLSYRVMENNGLTVFADCTGGDNINQYSTLVERNHFFNPVYLLAWTVTPIMENTIDKYIATIGVRGQVGGHLQYKASASYSNTANFVMDGLYQTSRKNPVDLMSSYNYVGIKQFYVEASLLWISERVEARGYFKYLKATPYVYDQIAVCGVPYRANGYITYNWSKRIYVGVTAEYNSERPTYYVIPSWVDLGVNAEYRFNNKISFWVKGCNLLNQTIQRDLLHAADGIYATGGISLCF